MTADPNWQMHDNAPRSLANALWRGWRTRCPQCGRGNLFERLLTTVANCGECGEELHHHRADDLPAYLNILVVGHLVIGALTALMFARMLPVGGVVAIGIVIAVALAFVLMRPLKGVVIAAQWALFMHGFGDGDEWVDEVEVP